MWSRPAAPPSDMLTSHATAPPSPRGHKSTARARRACPFAVAPMIHRRQPHIAGDARSMRATSGDGTWNTRFGGSTTSAACASSMRSSPFSSRASFTRAARLLCSRRFWDRLYYLNAIRNTMSSKSSSARPSLQQYLRPFGKFSMIIAAPLCHD